MKRSSQNGHNPIELNPDERAFIESYGLHFEKTYNVPRIGGRILGLLLIAPRPVTMAEIGKVFKFSHGSVSNNLRFLGLLGLVDKITLPGERTDYYRFSEAAWSQLLTKQLDGIIELRLLADRALRDLDLRGPARLRFEEITAWAGLVQSRYKELMDDWSNQRQALIGGSI